MVAIEVVVQSDPRDDSADQALDPDQSFGAVHDPAVVVERRSHGLDELGRRDADLVLSR